MNFEQLWALKPEGQSKVYVYDKEKETHYEKTIFRSYLTYLAVPPFNTDLPKSYMYDGVQDSVPNILLPYLKQTWQQDHRYNQLVVNFYRPEDYIEPHRDCDHYMVDEYQIKIASFHDESPRAIKFESVDGTQNGFELDTADNVYIDKKYNTEFRHSVDPGEGRRISLTFRMLDMDKVEVDREKYDRK